MNNINRFWKSCLQYISIALLFISLTPGCTKSPVSPSVTSSAEPSSSPLQTVDPKQANQENGILSSPSALPSITSTIMLTPLAGVLPDLTLTEIISQDVVWEMINQVNASRVQNDLSFLTGENPICTGNNECYTIKNRFTGSKGLKWAKEYIYKELSSLGYSVEVEDWSLGGLSDQNIIARKRGDLYPDEEIYLVAHLDGVKEILTEKFPAADDNATGVVDLLETARILSNYSFRRTVVFLFSTGEEKGRLGVISYLNQLSESEIKSIKYAVNVDMLGYDANQDKVIELWHADDPPSKELTTLMFDIIQDYELDLVPRYVVGCG